MLKKIKKRIKKLSKRKTPLGKIMKKCLKVYRITWRYFYCIIQSRLGIQSNKIVFVSHKGKQYSCNPKYISEYLQTNYSKEFDIVWAFNEPKKYKELQERNIRVVKHQSKAHLKELVTAKVIVTNVDTYLYLPKIKGQIVLDTWHGGGAYKTCGFLNPQNLMKISKKLQLKRLYSRITLYCSSSKVFSELTIRKSRLFEGEILEIGMPRNDILVMNNRPDIISKVKNYFLLDENTKIVLYAPTYRSQDEQSEMEKLNVETLLIALGKRFGGKWECLYRAHHLDKNGSCVNDATNYPDMQELLYAADVLITDYSSSIWDFSLTFKPVFLYCPDIYQYSHSRNFYLPVKEWPFILSDNNKTLLERIEHFDENTYRKNVELHHRQLGNCETGEATKILCERIYRECVK